MSDRVDMVKLGHAILHRAKRVGVASAFRWFIPVERYIPGVDTWQHVGYRAHDQFISNNAIKTPGRPLG